jgi:acetylornithine deacetylase
MSAPTTAVTSPTAARSPKEILAALVAFDTVSHKTNIPMAEWVRAYLASHGVESHMIPAENGIHTSLFATVGPPGDGGIGLSGHMDVVPVVGQAWDTDPFQMVERDGRLYGRGTSDMKGYLACVLAAVPDFKRRVLKTPLHVVFSYDEEVGCTGVRPMIAEFGTRLPKPRMMFVGEPTSMKVVDAHKGGARFRVELKGRAAHSSNPALGVNTITYAMRLLAELERMEHELRAKTDPRFDPPYSTLQVTRIEAGAASNIVPVDCWFGWEIRALPRHDVSALEARFRRVADACLEDMRRTAPEAEIRIMRAQAGIPAFEVDATSEVVGLAYKLAQQNETFAVSYGTEASLFHVAGCASVVCGPGDIAQAHTANEWIAVDELDKGMAFMRRLGDWAEAA